MDDRRWSLLIHNIPPKPAYLRNKVAHRLNGLGAVALKNSVYVLPDSAVAREGFMWLAEEVEAGGGKAFVGHAVFLGDDAGERIRGMFLAARNRDYQPLLEEAARLEEGLAAAELPVEERGPWLRRGMDGIRKQVGEIRRIDFFSAPDGELLEGKLAALEARLECFLGEKGGKDLVLDPMDYRGKRWVTRPGVFVDRMACAWLIRRFIDGEAVFAFAAGWNGGPQEGEIFFDTPRGGFTHEGEMCTFEVLVHRFGLAGAPLKKLARLVHDIDMKVAEVAHAETRGVEAMLAAIAMTSGDDEERLRRAGVVFDDLLGWFAAGGRG